MATLKLDIQRDRPKQNGECLIFVRITHNRKIARIKTKWHVNPVNWENDIVKGGKNGDKNYQKKNFKLGEILQNYEKKLIDNHEKINKITVQQIRDFLNTGADPMTTDFIRFTEMRIEELKSNSSASVRHLENALVMVKNFHEKPTLDFSQMTRRWLESFTAYYYAKGHKINSVATYLRYIRTMFNLAIDDLNTDLKDPLIKHYPFRKFKIEKEESRHRNLSVDVVRMIRDYKTANKLEAITRDFFMLQMYLLGTNTIDLFYMPQTALIDGRLISKRIKTGRSINFKIEPEAQVIIKSFCGKKYLFWFADYCSEERPLSRIKHARKSHLQYANSEAFNKMINVNLEKIKVNIISEKQKENPKFDLTDKITDYFARHTFASLMREIGISKDDISLCLTHKAIEKEQQVTGTYIAEDYEKIDLANRELIDFINSDIKDGKAWKEFKTIPPMLGA